MKYLLTSALCLVSALAFSGCGGGSGQTTSPTPQLVFFDVTGNWQFTTASTAAMKPLSIAGSFNQSLSEVRGTIHVVGSDCFDPLTTVGLAGKLASSNITLTSTSTSRQVIKLAGHIGGDSFSGTFSIEGGCAGGDQGTVTAVKMPSITSQLTGTFSVSGEQAFTLTAQLTQSAANSDGSYGITGAATFGPSCFKTGTIVSGDFTSGSFILGSSVRLEIESDNGTISFHGTADQSGHIKGDFAISNSTCNKTGTAVFVATGQWD